MRALRFPCAARFEQVLLGFFDGSGSWTVRVGAERSRDEQVLVSVHERLHYLLQTTTPWGLLVTASLAFGAWESAGPKPLVARHVADGCRLTHEAFATYFSVGDDETDRALLEGNTEYEEHYRRAEALGRAATQWPDRSRIVDALLRAAMCPLRTVAIDPVDLVDLRVADVADADLPDERLQRIVELVEADGGAAVAALLPEARGADGLVRFRDAVAGLLTEWGVPTTSFAAHRHWVIAVLEELNRMRPAHAPAFEATGAIDDPVREDADDQQRERLRLHDDPLPLEIVDPRSLPERGRDFTRVHADVGAHTLVVWFRVDLLRRQFVVPGPLDGANGHVLGLLSCDRTHGHPRAMLCPVPQAPAVLLARLSSAGPVLVLTSLATIVDTDPGVRFEGSPLVFALIDQPVVGFVEHTVDHGAVLRWEPVWIDGDRELSVYVFVNDELPGILFLHIATSAGRMTLSRWLRTLPAAQVIHDPSLGEGSEHAGRLHAVIEHVIGAFWELHQFGGRVLD